MYLEKNLNKIEKNLIKSTFFQQKSQKIQENHTKKLAELKIFYKKKLKSLKNELKSMKTTIKDLEISEEKRLEIFKEFEAFKGKVHEEQYRLSSEHCEQMKRLEEISYSKLVNFIKIFYKYDEKVERIRKSTRKQNSSRKREFIQ